ncbi:MFS transporter [Lacticaseibacillus songhuajiangensis]|uniref:MFS transporter n=1 Tax=Lacticaseibacillus songhuajiangensis TaxID=1296539 RepID=UPI000F7B49EB|nr:MFS transporter [Lacticaseibacillus songhuajiangensis]
MSKTTKRAIFILVFSEFLVCLGMSLIFPVMPFLKNELHLSATDMGIMSSLFAFAQFVSSPIIGHMSDKIGRRPVLIVGLGLFAVSELLFAVTNYLVMFDISRIIGGIAAGMFIPTAQALAADITTHKQRARVIGLLSASLSGGLILGPGVGGILAGISYKTPFYLAAVLGLLAMLATLFFLPHYKAPTKQAAAATTTSTTDWRKVLGGPMLMLFLLILVSSFGLQSFESIYSIFVNEVFGFSLGDIALVLTLNGIISLIFQVVFFDRMVLFMGEIKLTRYAFLLSFVSIAWIMLAHTKWEVMVATLIVFTSFDLLRPAITTLLTKQGTQNQGIINGLNLSLTSIGNIVGPLMAGSLLDINYHIPYAVTVVILAISWILTYTVKLGRPRDYKHA